MIYQIVSFALVALLVPFLKIGQQGQGGARPAAAPIPAEA
jgi:hypothetical protein